MQAKNTYIVLSSAGLSRDLSTGSRGQLFWVEHAAFIDTLVDEGFIMLGGPLSDGGAMLIVYADSETEVRDRMKSDPWYEHGMLRLDTIKHWEIFIDHRT